MSNQSQNKIKATHNHISKKLKEKMSKYEIYTSIEMKLYVIVEANSEEDALEKASCLSDSKILKGQINDISTIDFIKAYKVK